MKQISRQSWDMHEVSNWSPWVTGDHLSYPHLHDVDGDGGDGDDDSDDGDDDGDDDDGNPKPFTWHEHKVIMWIIMWQLGWKGTEVAK